MSHETDTNRRSQLRVFMTGACDGADTLRAAVSMHPDVDFVGSSENVADAAGPLAGGHLDVVLHATRSASLPADELASIREHVRAPIMLVASGEASRLLDEALDADVADVLLLPQLPDNVVFALRKAAHHGRRAETVSGRKGTIVTVFSPKGGTGKTVLATNLASAMAKREGRKTLLLDLDLQFGDAAIMLGAEPEKTIFDLVVAPGELDSEKLSGYATHHPCGLELLPAPLRPEDAELVTEAKVARLLEVAREAYEVIVVDTSPFFHGAMLATLDRTDELFLLAALDVPTIKNVKLALQTLELLSFPRDRIRVILNRANSKVGMKPGDVENALGMKISHQVPSDRAVPVGVNRGEPVVLHDAGAEFTRAVVDIAKALVAGPEKAKRKGIFRQPVTA
ncbi:MAG TPA: AAA family ATPase [Gaiellaceae bacterium]|nr:AAA family ATPase [Gaiellaceae bacterium]